MATIVSSPTICKSFYAHLYDQSGVLAKVDGVIHFFGDDGSITEYEPEMAPWTMVLGQTDLADLQQVRDRLAGGYARICCSREQEVL